MNEEIYKAVSNYHIATMGDDRQEIEDAQQEYEMMKLVYGVDAVQEAVDYYNENVIRKAR
jgi:inhibitor of KinA sporulation pathway (predicted exonuclease)